MNVEIEPRLMKGGPGDRLIEGGGMTALMRSLNGERYMKYGGRLGAYEIEMSGRDSSKVPMSGIARKSRGGC